jgi:hypothetical protein
VRTLRDCKPKERGVPVLTEAEFIAKTGQKV